MTLRRSRFVVFLDVGDTLVDGRAELDYYFQVLSQFGLDVTREQVRLAFLSASNQLAPLGAHPGASTSRSAYLEFLRAGYELAAKECGAATQEDMRIVAADLMAFNFDKLSQLPTFPGTHEILSLLSQDYRLFAVSNWQWELEEFLDVSGLRQYFEGVINSAQVGYRKPHPQIFRTALALAEVRPERAVMVGDSYESDVLGAQGVGIGAVLVNRWGVPEGVRCPVADSLYELTELLESCFRSIG